MGLVKTLFTQAFPPALKDYYDSLISRLLFDAENTASGTSSVVINGLSGVAEFDYDTGLGSIAALGVQELTITNTSVSASSYVEAFLGEYPFNGINLEFIGVKSVSDGSFTVGVKNTDGSNPFSGGFNIVVGFKILNT